MPERGARIAVTLLMLLNVEDGMKRSESDGRRAGLILGAVLAALGVIMMVDRTEFAGLEGMGRLWPVMLIAVGLTHFIGPNHDLPHGFGLIATGIWLLAVTLTPLRFSETWPVMVVVLGVMTMWRALPAASIVEPGVRTDDRPSVPGGDDVR